MKVIAANGSPRKNWNTATLNKAIEGAKSVGAEAELFHLYDLNFKGCTSCFLCKRKGSKNNGICSMKDELTDCLTKISKCDVLFLGCPIYIGAITGVMHSFLERLLFAALAYDVGHSSTFLGESSSNAPEERAKSQNYQAILQFNEMGLKRLHGTSEYLVSYNTYQFDDYSKYDATMFDERAKARYRQNISQRNAKRRLILEQNLQDRQGNSFECSIDG
jgi:multimeric flavodoxin WrbA